MLGKMTSTDAGRNPPSWPSSDLYHRKKKESCFFVPFFAILDRCATLLMGMQWQGTRGLQEKRERMEEEAVVAAEEQ
jgi:hypothetical protein